MAGRRSSCTLQQSPLRPSRVRVCAHLTLFLAGPRDRFVRPGSWADPGRGTPSAGAGFQFQATLWLPPRTNRDQSVWRSQLAFLALSRSRKCDLRESRMVAVRDGRARWTPSAPPAARALFDHRHEKRRYSAPRRVSPREASSAQRCHRDSSPLNARHRDSSTQLRSGSPSTRATQARLMSGVNVWAWRLQSTTSWQIWSKTRKTGSNEFATAIYLNLAPSRPTPAMECARVCVAPRHVMVKPQRSPDAFRPTLRRQRAVQASACAAQ